MTRVSNTRSKKKKKNWLKKRGELALLCQLPKTKSYGDI